MKHRIGIAIVLLLAACQVPAAEEPMVRRAINSQLPARPYSQAVQVGDAFFFSGKVGMTEESQAMEAGRIEAETRKVMEGFRALFEEVGIGFEDVVQVTVFLANIDDYAGMNSVYGEYFPTDPPARETVAVKDIVGGAAVEISFIAVKR
jgi:2-iminobutanoate/2-iminopropanoate deaminase